MEKLINKTLGSFLDEIADKYPNSDAIIHNKKNVRYTYREFNEMCNLVAKGFMKIE